MTRMTGPDEDEPIAIEDPGDRIVEPLVLDDELEFDALLLAHGEPVRRGGRSALRTFADAPTAGAPPG